jgi:hypothetical protein
LACSLSTALAGVCLLTAGEPTGVVVLLATGVDVEVRPFQLDAAGAATAFVGPALAATGVALGAGAETPPPLH